MGWKLHAFVLIQAGRLGRKIVFETLPSHHCPRQGRLSRTLREPFGCEERANLVILVHEEKAVAESGTLRKGGTTKTRLVPDLETMT
jgi:hypothetical protein